MSRVAATPTLAVACLATAGCESVPALRFSVWEVAEEAPFAFEEGDVVPRPSGPPIAGAVVLLPVGRGPSEDLAVLAARIKDDAGLTDRMHPPIGSKDDGAFAMKTRSDGTADYSELRLWSSSPAVVERRFFVWAEGFEPRTVVVELGAESRGVGVPLVRRRAP